MTNETVPFVMNSTERKHLTDLGPVSRNSRKLFGPEKPFLKLRSAYSEKLVFYYDLKIRKVKFVAKFHTWKRRRFYDR